MLIIMIAYIPFNRVEDFIAGQTYADGSVVEWIVAARIHGYKCKDLKLIFILSMFIMSVHLDRKTIQEILNTLIKRNVDALLNFPSSNFFCFQM